MLDPDDIDWDAIITLIDEGEISVEQVAEVLELDVRDVIKLMEKTGVPPPPIDYYHAARGVEYTIIGDPLELFPGCSLDGTTIIPTGIAGGAAWVDGNTAANPTADDMDGIGTDLASLDTVNITKTLQINKSVGCDDLTCAGLTVDNTFTLTMDAGALIVDNGNTSIAGTLADAAGGAADFNGTWSVTATGAYVEPATTSTFSNTVTMLGTYTSQAGGNFRCDTSLTLNVWGTSETTADVHDFTIIADNVTVTLNDVNGGTGLCVGGTCDISACATTGGIASDSQEAVWLYTADVTPHVTHANASTYPYLFTYNITGNANIAATTHYNRLYIKSVDTATATLAGNVTATYVYVADHNTAQTCTCAIGANTLTSTGEVLIGTTATNKPGQVTVTTGELQADGAFTHAAYSGTSTITTGTFDFNSTCTIAGGTFGSNTSYTFDHAGAFLTSGSPTFNAPGSGGAWAAGNDIQINTGATFNNDGGAVSWSGGARYVNGTGSPSFYNFTVDATCYFQRTNTIENLLTVNADKIFSVNASYSPTTLTMGTGVAQGTIANSGTVDFDNNTTNHATIQAANSGQLCICTGTDWDWDDTASGYVDIKWLDYQIDATTGGTGVTVEITGNMTIDAFTVTANDTLTCTTQDTTITGVNTKTIRSYGTFQLNGASGHNIILTGIQNLAMEGTSTVDLQYVTISSKYCTFGNIDTTVGTITQCDNITFTLSTSGLEFRWLSGPATVTNSTITGPDGGAWNTEDIVVWTGGSAQLDTCTYTTVGMQATSGWLESVDVSGNYTHYGILASSETPDTGYKGSECAGTFTIKNADAYSTSFNSSYTLGAGIAPTSCTINASTTFDTSGTNYSFTTTTACNVSGTLNLNGSTVSCTGTGTPSGYSIQGDGVVNGGSATITFGSLYMSGSVWSWSSGTMTINSVNTGAISYALGSGLAPAHNNGTIIFTRAGAQAMYSGDNTAQTFYNLQLNNASCALTYTATKSFATTVANNLTITAGSFTTWDGTTSANLTVTSATSITGTLDLKASASVSLGTGWATDLYAVTIESGGVLTGGTGTAHTIGCIWIKTGGSATFTSGTTTINGNGGNPTNSSIALARDGTFDDGNGTLTFTYAGNQFIYTGTGGATLTLYNLIVNNASAVVRGLVNYGPSFQIDNNLTITAGTLNTRESTGSNDRSLTVTSLTSITGSLVTNASTVSLGSGVTAAYALTITSGGTFTGGSGTHTIGSISAENSFTNVTFTSGSMTVNGCHSSTTAISFGTVGTFDDGNGTIIFTRAGTQLLSSAANAARTFYNLTVNNASCVLQHLNTAGFAITIDNDLTITSGQLSTVETVSGTSRNLTVTGDTSIAASGTLTTNGSTVDLGAIVNNGVLNMNGRTILSHTGQATGNGTCKVSQNAIIYRSDLDDVPFPQKLPMPIPIPDYPWNFIGVIS